MFKQQSMQLNSSSSKTNIPLTTTMATTGNNLDRLPITLNTTRRFTDTEIPFQRIRTTAKMPSNLTIERCCFLFIHLLFYVIIFTIVYTRLDQFTARQEKLLLSLHSSDNRTLQKELQRRFLAYNHVPHSENNIECASLPHLFPKRNRTTGCLELRVGSSQTIQNVFCSLAGHRSSDNDRHNISWLTIQNRQATEIDFNRTWTEYRRGFGNIQDGNDFWIGNDNLHWLTTKYICQLRIELTDWYNTTRMATYEVFRIADQNDGYRIQIDEYHGDMEPYNKIDSFIRYHRNARFSTHDHYATGSINCPMVHGGAGWWYHSGDECAHVQLNGQIATHSDGLVPLNMGLLWIGWRSDRNYSFQRARMAIQPKLRRKNFRRRRRR